MPEGAGHGMSAGCADELTGRAEAVQGDLLGVQRDLEALGQHGHIGLLARRRFLIDALDTDGAQGHDPSREQMVEKAEVCFQVRMVGRH